MKQETRSAHAAQLPGGTSRSDEDLLKQQALTVAKYTSLTYILLWRTSPC